jgi:MFS family permease
MAAVSTAPRTSTFSALKHNNFKLYFGGQFVSISGQWMQGLAQGWLVYALTGSELMLGLVACAGGLPSLLLSPFAGVLVDRFRRRDILLLTQTAAMVFALVLAWLTLTGIVQVWHVILLAFLNGVTGTLDAPARQSFIRDMVGADDLASGITLNSMMTNGGRIIGPAFAGVILATVGAGWCFFINGITFLAVLSSLWIMRVPAPKLVERRTSPLRQLREGLTYSRQHEIIAPLILLAAIICVFVVNVVTILPSFAATVLHSPVSGYSTLSTAQGIGAVVGALALAWLSNRLGRGHMVVLMSMVLSVAALMLANMNQVLPAAIFMGVMGFGFVSFFVTVNTMLQNVVPDDFRGRVLSLYTLTFMGLTPFGALALGYIAERIGTPDALSLYAVVNGLLCGLVLLRWPKVRSVV